MSKKTRTTNATKVPALPSAPNKVDPQLKKFLDSMVEAIEIRLGRRGDPRDRAITLRELIDSGLAKELATNPYDPNKNSFGPITETVNLSRVIGKPVNVVVSAGFTAILIQWDLWKHQNHIYTHVYRHTSDSRNDAVKIGSSTSQFFTDEDVSAGTTYYYWAKHENTFGEISEWNAEAGTSGTTQQDTAYILSLITSSITNSHLASALATDVGRIPGWHTIIGNYNATGNRTLTQLNSGVSTNLASIDSINTDIYDSSGAIKLATVAVTDGLRTDVNSNDSDISVNTTAITGIENSLYVNGDSSQGLLLATAAAHNTTVASVSTNTGNIATNLASINTLNSDVYDNSGTVKLATVAVTDSLLAGIEANEDEIDVNAGKITTLETKVNITDGGMATADAHDALYATVNTGASSHAAKITTLETKVNITDGGMATANAHDGLYATVNTGTSSHAAKLTALEATVDDGTGGVVATASALDLLETKVGYSHKPNNGGVLFDDGGTIKSSSDVATYNTNNSLGSTDSGYVQWVEGLPAAQMATKIQVSDGTNSHTLAEQAQTVSGANGLTSQYSVKIETHNGVNYVAGFGLSTETSGITGSSYTDFQIAANRFSIRNPTAGEDDVIPFAVYTSTETLNGETISPGVYIDGAKILNGSITNAVIGDAVIDNAKITTGLDAAKVTTGTLQTSRLNIDTSAFYRDPSTDVLTIAELAIGTAHINNANVTTLKIAGEAATVPYGLAGSGGVTVAQEAGNTVTDWTDISGGGISINYNTSGGLTPQKVSLVLTTQMLCSSSTSSNVVSMIFRIYDGANWLEEGHVGFGAMDDQSFTFTSGATFTPNGAGTTSGGSVIIKVYARKTHNTSTFTTGSSHLMVIGTRR